MGKNLSKIFSGGAMASSASFLLRYSRSFDDPVSKILFFSASQSKRAVLQEVMLIDSYSCSCPVLVMHLRTCCEPANGYCMILCLYVCVRATFVFVNTSEKASAWVIVYNVLYRFNETGLINMIGCQSVQMFEWFLLLYRFCAFC